MFARMPGPPNGNKAVSSTNGVEKTGHPQCKRLKLDTLYYIQKLTQNRIKTKVQCLTP